MIQSSDNCFTLQEIIRQEIKILWNLEWDINLPSFSTWINICTLNWDIFIDDLPYLMEETQIDLRSFLLFKFRNRCIESFNLFQTLTQVIDLISLDVEYLSYMEKYLTVATIFLLILKGFNIIDFSQIPFLKLDHLEELGILVFVFNKFLNKFYNLEFNNIFDHIQYVSCYMNSNFVYEMENCEKVFFYLK